MSHVVLHLIAAAVVASSSTCQWNGACSLSIQSLCTYYKDIVPYHKSDYWNQWTNRFCGCTDLTTETDCSAQADCQWTNGSALGYDSFCVLSSGNTTAPAIDMGQDDVSNALAIAARTTRYVSDSEECSALSQEATCRAHKSSPLTTAAPGSGGAGLSEVTVDVDVPNELCTWFGKCFVSTRALCSYYIYLSTIYKNDQWNQFVNEYCSCSVLNRSDCESNSKCTYTDGHQSGFSSFCTYGRTIGPPFVDTSNFGAKEIKLLEQAGQLFAHGAEICSIQNDQALCKSVDFNLIKSPAKTTRKSGTTGRTTAHVRTTSRPTIPVTSSGGSLGGISVGLLAVVVTVLL